MPKKQIEPGPFVVPMPIALIGAMVDGKANFMTAAFLGIVNFEPPVICCGLNPKHHTCKGIEANREFSICLPSAGQVVVTDYCGIVGGDKMDKSELFDVEFGTLKQAPLIAQFPLCVECKLIDTKPFDVDVAYFGQIVNVHAEEEILTEGNVDWKKIRPLLFTFPDRSYWQLGDYVAPAWKIGNEYKK